MNAETKPAQGRRNALYARVSTDKQAQERTIASQVASLQERIAADGGVLDEASSFIDDGVSGTSLVRPALERLRDQAAAGAIERLYVLTPDRLARRHAHQMVLVEELQACGVELVFLNGPLGQTPEDRLLLQVQGMIAEYERAKILERTRRGRLHAARCGQVSVLSQAPYGYRYRDKHSGGGRASFEIIEEEAQVVRQIFAWLAREGCTLWEVARRLHAQGVPTRKGRERWNPGTLSYLVRNRTYCGQATYNKEGRTERRPRLRPRRGQPEVPKQTSSTYRRPVSEHIPIAVPALVDEALFAAAQERMAENRQRARQRHSGARYLLQGLLVCSRCGYAWGGYRSAAGRAPHYRCGGAMNYRLTGKPLCRLGQQRTDDLDSAVWQDVCALLNEPDRLRDEFQRRQRRSAGGPLPAEQERLRCALNKVKQSISRLIDAYAASLLDAAEFEPRIRQLKERLRQLENESRQLAEQVQEEAELRLICSQWEDFADQIKDGLANATWEQRRAILRALVKRVEIDEGTLRIVYKVTAHPFARGPNRGPVQDCWTRPETAIDGH